MAAIVLERAGTPLGPREIVARARRERLFSDHIAGKPPHQTMKSKLSVDIRKRGDRSEFIRTAPGQFSLRRLHGDPDTIYYAQPQNRPHTREMVLVFSASAVADIDPFQGISLDWPRYINLIKHAGVRIIPRLEAEQTEDYKQLLTYVLVQGPLGVLSYRRGSFTSAAEMLRGSLCIGFGGHVTQDDYDLLSEATLGIFSCARRELTEEIHLSTTAHMKNEPDPKLQIVGVLNDDSTSVGRRHFAFVLTYNVENCTSWERPQRGEKSITQLKWLSSESAQLSIWDFEYWSQLCIRAFCSDLVRISAAYRLRRARPFRSRHIACVVGTIGSGKTEICRVLSGSFRYNTVNSGYVLASLLGIPPVGELGRRDFQDRAGRFMAQSSGFELLASAIMAQVRACNSDRVLVDGLRHIETLEQLRGRSDNWKVATIFVQTSPDLAFRLYKERENPTASFREYLSATADPSEGDVNAFLPESDVVVYNWQGQESLRTLIEMLGRQLGLDR